MIVGRRVLALVPARYGSKGLPLKNIRPLGGRPLLAWPIAAACGSRYVDKVVLSTDDEGFAEIGRAHGAEVPFLRPAALASDTAPSIDFILHALDMLAAEGETFDLLVLLEPTSPLTEAADVDRALEQLVAADGVADAIVGLTEMTTTHPAFAVRLGDGGAIAPLAGGAFADLPRRQDLDPVFCLDGSLYISTVTALRDKRGFCHDRTLGYPTERHKALEIDDLVDFLCVEAVFHHLGAAADAPIAPSRDRTNDA